MLLHIALKHDSFSTFLLGGNMEGILPVLHMQSREMTIRIIADHPQTAPTAGEAFFFIGTHLRLGAPNDLQAWPILLACACACAWAVGEGKGSAGNRALTDLNE